MSKRRGFTLIETLVTIAVFGLVMVVTAELLRIIFMNSSTNPNALRSSACRTSPGCASIPKKPKT